MTEPKISVICNAFHHGKYIRDALEGFVGQHLNVPMEILVHDDASPDDTADVIREYERRFPQLLRPIYQTENQYSKKVQITVQIQIPRALGKYVAFCEGDDYWTDMDKLQTQYDFLEAHPEYSGCCHAYQMVDKDRRLIEERHDLPGDGPIPMAKLIGNQLEVPHYATLFVRRECLQGLEVKFLDKRCNDMVTRLYCASQRPLYYLDRVMSCYRRFTENSWTIRVGMNSRKMAKGNLKNVDFLRKFDDYTHGKYHQEIEQAIDWREFEAALRDGDYRLARRKEAFARANWKRKTYITLGCLCPSLMNLLRKK